MQPFDFHMMVDNLPQMIWVAGVDGRSVYSNPRMLAYFGWSLEDVQRRDWLEHVHPDDRQRSSMVWAEAVATGAEYHIDYRLQRAADGQYLWHEGHATPMRDAAGTILFWFGLCTDIDERKQVETRLLESERKFRLLHESMQDAFVSVSMDGRLQEFNAVYEKLLGYTAGELHDKSYVDLTPERWHALESRIVAEQILTRGYSDVYEKEYRRKDGTLVPIELRTVLLRAADGTPEFMWANIRDISERELLREQLLASEERFRSLMDLSPDIISIVKEDGTLSYNSPAALEIHGYTQEEMVGRNTFALIHPEDQSAVTAYCEKVFRNLPGPRSIQYRYRNKDGSYVWMEATASNQLDNPNIRGMVAISRDISERKAVEQKLQVSEETFAKTFHNSLLLMTLSDCETGRYLDVNELFCQVSGFSREEAIGQTSLELGWVQAKDRQGIFEELKAHGRVSGRDLKLTSKRGETVWCRYFGELIATGSGQVVLSIAKDITESKAVAAALERAKTAAEVASRAKSEFLANMSHEIRTPITAIMGMSELLVDTELSTSQRGYLETILTSTENLLELIDDILDLSKVEANQLELVHEVFSLRGLLREVVDNQLLIAETKGLALRSNISVGVPDRLNGDPLRLKQVLFNLVGNAVKFTGRGEVALTVAVEGLREDGVCLDFAIADTGIGISPEQQEKIFSPFQQADSSISRIYGGTGLGLAICTRLVKLMGGTLRVESREGVGSTFHVRVTFVLAESGAEGKGASKGRCLPLSTKGTLSLLLAEDNDASRMFFVEVLQKYGYRVETALNGKDALEKWLQGGYDMVLMDIQMPIMDGLTAIDRIREVEKERGGHVPVIAITAHAMEVDRETIMTKGFDGYLAKPTRIRELLDEIERCRPPCSAGPAGSDRN